MDSRFSRLTESLHAKAEALRSMDPVTVDSIPTDTPTGGVYLFSSHGRHLYVGRTKRKIRERIKDHVSTADDCPFAWRLAREATNNKVATYRSKGSRKDLLSQPSFKRAYEKAKNQIRQMEVRYVGEPDPLRQALLEIYVAVVTEAEHNDFDTH